MHKAIEKRISVRNYLKKPLSVADMTKVTEILEFVEEKKGPFSHQVRFFFVDNINKEGRKIGTYGFIKNPPTFIGGVVKNTLEGLVDFGFLFEEVILRLAAHGLGTVWLGGTFDRTDFDVPMSEGEVIACVSPVGYPASKSIRERVIRSFSGADNRMPFDELFFLGKELKKIDQDHPYYHVLKAIQFAPSASNKQPWRVVFEEDTFHMYLNRTKGYGDFAKMDIQAVDIGIALSHLVLSINEDGQGVEYIMKKPFDVEDCLYILSVKIHHASAC